MKRIKNVPTREYIRKILSEPSIHKVIESWSLEYDVMTNAITAYLEKMGIFEINPITQKKIIVDTVISQLHNNPIIQKRIVELKRMQDENISRKRKSF